MRETVTPMRQFGRRVAEAQDEALREQASVEDARALFLSPRRAPEAPRRGTDRWLWAGAATAATTLAAAASFHFLVRTSVPAPAFRVGPGEESVAGAGAKDGVVGELVAAPGDGRLPVHFSDGSLIRLEPEARARIVEVSDNGSRVLLESGGLRASIVHHTETRWTVQAGPFEVHVTGTQFDVAWDPPRRLFTITLLEGRVAVSGCAIDQARFVTTGETFRATCEDETPSAPPVSPSAIAPSIPVPPSTTSSRPTPALTWRELLTLHRYAEAVDVADAAGLSSICATADLATLMDLSDAARFARRFDRAKLILLQVRRRFAGDERASTAAFNLGRIAFDNEAAYAEASRWFNVYVVERPGGPLVREASGRRMEALERSGDHAGARSAAERYLQDFPTGPHAQVARSIADR